MLKHRSGSSSLLLQSTAEEYMQQLHRAGKLSKMKRKTPHLVRHGGASHDAAAKVSEETFTLRGGCAKAKSVLRYRNEGKYLKALQDLNAHI